MKMVNRVVILHGTTQEYFHHIPGELERATVSPERDAILRYLAKIGPKRFPEFVADLLVQIDGHELVDITDGPGDEKQDILTITPQGQRQLTQCKHTRNPEKNDSGGELDQLFSAAFRKNCRKVLYVTNADLTVQAKRYVNDG